jgi:F0F1-type ATP synthase membrane subunit b/b'
MEQTLQALGAILLKAIPTICLLLLLHFYFKAMLFGPLEKILKQRDELTGGARKAAQESLTAADEKQRKYEAKFREAKGEVYRAMEETRRGWLEDQAAQIADSRRQSENSVRAAKQQVAAEADAARKDLAESSSALGDRIATTLLAPRAEMTQGAE